jgi:ABC-type antimicrobial peptide transport system permease subunit
MGIAIGVAALIATIGISQSAGAQIVTRFFETQSTFLSVTAPPDDPSAIFGEAAGELARIPGVTSVAKSNVVTGGRVVRSRVAIGSEASLNQSLTVLSAGPGLFETIGADFVSGRSFDAGHMERKSSVAVLGTGAAARLGITSVDGRSSVFVDGHPLVVIGVVGDVAFHEQALNSLILPETSAESMFGEPQTTILLLDTNRNSTYTVAGRIPKVLDPAAVSEVQVSIPAPPPDVGAAVSDDLDALTLTLATVGAVVAAISVAAIMLINVVERVPEIGLRRALGASRKAIAVQFLLESTAVGFASGAVGVLLGLVAVNTVASVRDWIPVMSANVPVLGLGVGTLIGMLAGVYPAMKASLISPSKSLRA